ncbi:MAG: hypothetical protein MJ054_00270 [Clostridia bacterium]|nr:hypothetical protein [Clostridia bacterium]
MSNSTKVTQKCKICGGDLFFNPSKGGLLCQRCGNFQTVVGEVTSEKSFQSLLNNAPTWKKDTTVLRCVHCGAKSVKTKSDLVVRCEYCGVANMVKTQDVPGICPDTIVLFEMNQVEAKKRVNDWLAKRFFVPSKFKNLLKERQLSGIYYPAFTFDANVVTKYTGTLVQTTTSTTTVDGNDVTQSQTTRRSIHDVDTQSFDDILILANENEISTKVLKQLDTFNTNNGQSFQQSYLAGFTVCQASKEALVCWEEAKKTIEETIRMKISARYTNDSIRIENLHLDFDITNITYKYVLLPVYIGHVDYKRKQYRLYVNGQTGKISGKTPRSWWKVLFTYLVTGVFLFGVGIFLAKIL